MARPLLFLDHAPALGGAEKSLLLLLKHLDRSRWIPHLACGGLAGRRGRRTERCRPLSADAPPSPFSSRLWMGFSPPAPSLVWPERSAWRCWSRIPSARLSMVALAPVSPVSLSSGTCTISGSLKSALIASGPTGWASGFFVLLPPTPLPTPVPRRTTCPVRTKRPWSITALR